MGLVQIEREASRPRRSAPLDVLAARVSLYGAAAAILLLLLLHFVKPELDPSWRFLSEYAFGRNGWIMVLAFEIWALSCAALFLALKDQTASRWGRIGRYLLLVVAVALVFAGLFPQDPITARPEEQTPQGMIHAIASMFGIPGIPIAAMLVSRSLTKHNAAWAPHRAAVMWPAHLTWISLLLMTLYLAWAVPRAGGFNAEVWAGWINRFVVATYLLWQLVVTGLALRVSEVRKLDRV